jgi:hypothetical protein
MPDRAPTAISVITGATLATAQLGY